MDSHSYDGKERRFLSSDPCKDGLSIVKKILGFAPNATDLIYDLSFYSDGMGLLDNVAISMSIDDEMEIILKEKFELQTPEQACKDNTWVKDFKWLIDSEDTRFNIREYALNFINDNKFSFQPISELDDEIYFVKWSNVNGWTAIWKKGMKVNYIDYCQG
ncbi:MAG: hypothetical protein GY760_14455 [Deltaproteobacteria bacterium]|nr:hypothetical protein [Deltaproteobacteria bacterium]